MEPGDATRTSVSTASEPTLLTVEEAAQRLRLARTAIYRFISAGSLVSVKLGRCRRIPTWAIDAFIRQTAETQGHGGRGIG
jgi:excisionase family DNA binding protein